MIFFQTLYNFAKNESSYAFFYNLGPLLNFSKKKKNM